MRSSMQVVRTVDLCEPLLSSRLACIPRVPNPSPGLLPQAPGQMAGGKTHQACGMETPHAHGARKERLRYTEHRKYDAIAGNGRGRA